MDISVATVLTVYGIETSSILVISLVEWLLQQYLPFTVLKPHNLHQTYYIQLVATVLTVYGIET